MSIQMPSESAASSNVEVLRKFRPVGFLARYLVFIDGVSVGEAKTGSLTKFPVPTGYHEVQIWNRAMRMCSDSIAIKLAAGQTASFVCRSNPSGIFDMPLGGTRHEVNSLREVKKEGFVVKGGIALSLTPKFVG